MFCFYLCCLQGIQCCISCIFYLYESNVFSFITEMYSIHVRLNVIWPAVKVLSLTFPKFIVFSYRYFFITLLPSICKHLKSENGHIHLLERAFSCYFNKHLLPHAIMSQKTLLPVFTLGIKKIKVIYSGHFLA